MTEQEKQRRLAEIDAELARRSGDKKALAEATNRLFQLQVPKQSTVPSLSPTVTEPASARLARTGQATAETLGAARPKAYPRNAPDTGATSLVTNKVKVTPAPARTQPTAKTQGTPTRRLTYDQAQKALTASGGGIPAKGLEAVDKAFKDVQKAKESQSPRALDKQFAAELALKQALGESTMKGRTAEQLRQGEVLRQGRGTPYVAPDTAQQDLEAAVITTLLGIAPGVGGQLAIGAAGKLIPEATQAARPMLSNLLKGGAAIGGAAGTAKAQDIALENVLGQDQYTKMQQNLAEFQGRQPLLTSMLQGGAGAIMQRPSLAASLGERLVGAGMGAGLSVGGDIMAGQPTDLSKAGIEALVNAAFAGPNTKSGDVLESIGAKAVTPLVPKAKKVSKAFSGILAPPTAPQGVSFVDPNTPAPTPVAKIGTTAQAPVKPKVTLPTGETGTVSPDSLITTAPTQLKGKAPATAPDTASVPAQPAKQTAETFTRPAEPVKETPKSEQVNFKEGDVVESAGARFTFVRQLPNGGAELSSDTGSFEIDSNELSSLKFIQSKPKQSALPEYHKVTKSDFVNYALTQRLDLAKQKLSEVTDRVKGIVAKSDLKVPAGISWRQALEVHVNESGRPNKELRAAYRELTAAQNSVSIAQKAFDEPSSIGTQKFTEEGVHRNIVQKALESGKSVPSEVLADYPDLAAKYGKTTAESTAEPVKETPKSESMAAKESVADFSRLQMTDLNVVREGMARLKQELGEREASKYFKNVNRLFDVNNNHIVEYRKNGVVTEKDGTYTLHLLAWTDTNNSWGVLGKIDVTDQFASKANTAEVSTPEPTKSEVTPPVVKEPLSAAKQTLLARQVESSLANLNSPDKATSEAARASLDESLATLRDNAIIKGEGVKTTGAVTSKESFAQSVKDAFGVTDEQAGELSDLVDDWANGWAKKERESGRLPNATAADFYATIGGIHRFDDDLAQLVLGKKAATSKGARLPESKVIVALQRGDTTTAVHEMAHHFLDTLPEAARKKVMDSLPGTTASNVHEQFATGFEAGLKDANSPLHRYYKKFKMWIDETYKGLVNKWKAYKNYEEGGLRVTTTGMGNVVSFTTGLKGDALDVVMDYINTGRMAKGSAVEGVPAPNAEAPIQTPDGRKIYKVRFKDGQERWALQSIDNVGKDSTSGDTLHKTIDDALKMAEIDRKNQESRLRNKSEQEAKDLKSADAENQLIESYKGFLDNKTAMAVGKLRKILETNVLNKGLQVSRKELIEKAVSEGYVVKNVPERTFTLNGREVKEPAGRVLVNSNGSEFSQKSITSIGMDYAQHLISAPKVEAVAPKSEQVQVSKQPWEMTRKEFESPYIGPKYDILEQSATRGDVELGRFYRKDGSWWSKKQGEWPPSDLRITDPTSIRRLDHEVSVLEALEQGKEVPPKVLADYPDLAAKYGKSTEPQFQTDENRRRIEGQKGSATTQVATTQGSYKKAAELLRDSGITGRVLDYGAGLGLGSDAVRTVIPNSESYEPFPERWKSTTPPTYTDSSKIQGKFDGIVNLNVLNVLEPSIRDAVLTDIGNLLKVGGKAVVGTRKWQGDVNLAKNSRPGDEPKAIWIAKSGGDVYQKGFDGNELKDYAESLLGPDYAVRKINGIAASGIEITRLRDSSSEPQFQTDESANESTVRDIPLNNAYILRFFDVDPNTLKDNSTTIEAERKKIMALANDPKFAGDVISKIESGNRVITPTLSAENAVAAAEIARRRTVWEVAKDAGIEQSKIDKAFADYMKFVQATKDIGTEIALAMRMRQESIGSDPLDPDSYISRAASWFTRDLNDPKFKEFVDKITAKSAVARQSYDNLQAEIARLNAQVDELLKGTPAETEVKKAEAEQQVFGTTTVPKRKKVAEGTTGATEGQKSAGGATTPRVSGTTTKVKSNANRDRAFAKLKSDKISDSVSSIAKEALSIAQGLASKYGGKKVQFQSDDDIDVDTQDISEFRRDMIGVGRGLLAAGTRNFKTWKEEIGGILDDAGIDPLEEHQYQVLWVDSKLSLRDEVGDVQSIKSSTAGTTIQQVIGSLGLDGAGRWLDGISDQDGNPTIFEKMVKGEDLTPAELDGAARVWMEVQRANGLKVSKRGKEGALADIKRVASEIRARDRKAAKQSEYVPLTSEQGADIVRKALARVRTTTQEKSATDPVRLAAYEIVAAIKNLKVKAVDHQSPEAVQKTVDDALTLLEQGKVAESKALLKDSTAEVVRLRKEARIAETRAKNEAAKGPFTQAQAEERIAKAIAGLGEASKAKPSTDPLKKSAGDLVAAINRTKTALAGKAPLSEVTQAAEEALARYKSGDLEGAKQALADLREKYPSTTADVTMDKALASISAMTKKLGKLTGDSEVNVDPSLRARLSRFNALAVALAKKSIGTEKGQLSTTEFTALVDSAAQAFRDAGSDVEKHQQVLRDLRSSVLKARGLDPNARYQFSGKSDATLRAETDAKFAQDGQALVDLVKSYASGRKQSIPNPLIDVATAEYAKAGNSVVAWAKAVENRWGSKLDRDQLDALYAQAGRKFSAMKDPATGVPYAVQIRRIKEQMEYEVQKLTYDQLSPADKAIRSLGEIGMALTGNVASFDYSFAGRQAGTALILAPDLYAKSLLAGVKATGIGKVSPEQQALIFDNVSSAFFNDRFGSADYYKKIGLEITDDAFSDIYTHHGLITPNGRMVSEALSTVGARPALNLAAWAQEGATIKIGDKRSISLNAKVDEAKAQALRARAGNMRGPGQRSEAMNRMFVKQLRFDLFRRLTKDGMVYKRLTDQLESATTDAEKKAIQQKITFQEEYNKMVAKMISITTGKAAVERASVRNMLTTLGRVGVWSPSFWLSRVQAMTAYPAWDVVFGQNDLKAVDRLKLAAYPIALQQAEIQAFNLALFLLSRIPGVQIMGTDDDEAGGRKTPWNWLGADPLNTDFGKVKYEGQEYDLSAGMRKHIVFAQRSYELAAQGYEDWWREQKGQLPKDNEYDPYYDSKVTVEDGKRQLLQYIKSSMNPVAGTIYDITRGGAEDALGRKMSPLETSLRMIVPIPLANVAYSTLVDRPEEARRAAQTQDPALMQRVQNNNNTFVRDTILTSFADMVGVSSAVRDRELEDGIKQASKHSGWMSKGYVPSKKDDELRNEVTKLLKDSIALSGTGDTYPSKKEIDLQAREALKMLPLARMDRESLLAEKKKLVEQVAKGKKVHRYMKTTPFSINGNLPK